MLSFSFSLLLRPEYFAEFFQQKLEKEYCNRTVLTVSDELRVQQHLREVRLYLCVPFFGRNVDCHVNLSTLILSPL